MRHNRPPNPSEREAILELIEEDNAFISLLEEQLKLKKNQEKDALAMVDNLEIEVKEAEERLKTARELHEFFQQTENKLNRLKQSPSPPSTPISSVGTTPSLSSSLTTLMRRRSNMDTKENSRLSVLSFDTLLKLTTSYNDSTKAALEGSAVAVEEAVCALGHCRHDLQAALTVIQMRHDDVQLMQDQVSTSFLPGNHGLIMSFKGAGVERGEHEETRNV